MATTWTSVTVADVTSVGTTPKQTGSIAVAPNEGLYLDVQSSSHANNDITVRLQTSADDTTPWATAQEFTIPASDTDAKPLGMFVGAPYVRLEFVASGTADNPTLTTRAQRGPLNGA